MPTSEEKDLNDRIEQSADATVACPMCRAVAWTSLGAVSFLPPPALVQLVAMSCGGCGLVLTFDAARFRVRAGTSRHEP